jgi:uncharacterized RDD family membrane protein YckC
MSTSPDQLNPKFSNPDLANPDHHSIDTPELVAIEMPLAGIGSRFIALLVDMLIWIAGVIALLILFSLLAPAFQAFNRLSAQWVTAIVIFILFLFQWGYFTLFEAFWNGQTPGKKVAKIRVIQRSGRAIGILESMARNFIRVIDMTPFPLYAVGIVSVFVTRQHQRLGDLAAGTLVIRDHPEESPLWGDAGTRTFTAASLSSSLTPQTHPSPQSLPLEPHMRVNLPPGQIAKLSASDLEVLESFLSRRLDMPLDTRAALAERISTALRAKSGLELPPGVSTETFLEATARQLRDLARLG